MYGLGPQITLIVPLDLAKYSEEFSNDKLVKSVKFLLFVLLR